MSTLSFEPKWYQKEDVWAILIASAIIAAGAGMYAAGHAGAMKVLAVSIAS